MAVFVAGQAPIAIRRILRGVGLAWRRLSADFDGAHEGEEDYVADGAGVGEEHGEAVDAYAFACGGREAVAEGSDVVFVHLVGFVVALFLLVELVEEALALVFGVVELGEGVAYFEASDVELEALDPVGLVGLFLGERADGQGEVVDDCGLD